MPHAQDVAALYLGYRSCGLQWHDQARVTNVRAQRDYGRHGNTRSDLEATNEKQKRFGI